MPNQGDDPTAATVLLIVCLLIFEIPTQRSVFIVKKCSGLLHEHDLAKIFVWVHVLIRHFVARKELFIMQEYPDLCIHFPDC